MKLYNTRRTRRPAGICKMSRWIDILPLIYRSCIVFHKAWN